MHLQELPARRALDLRRKFAGPDGLEDLLCFSATPAQDHSRPIVTQRVTSRQGHHFLGVHSPLGVQLKVGEVQFHRDSHWRLALRTRKWAIWSAWSLSQAVPAFLSLACKTWRCPDSIMPDPMGSPNLRALG